MGIQDAARDSCLDIPDPDDMLSRTGNGQVSVASQGHGGDGRTALAPERVEALAAHQIPGIEDAIRATTHGPRAVAVRRESARAELPVVEDAKKLALALVPDPIVPSSEADSSHWPPTSTQSAVTSRSCPTSVMRSMLPGASSAGTMGLSQGRRAVDATRSSIATISGSRRSPSRPTSCVGSCCASWETPGRGQAQCVPDQVEHRIGLVRLEVANDGTDVRGLELCAKPVRVEQQPAALKMSTRAAQVVHVTSPGIEIRQSGRITPAVD